MTELVVELGERSYPIVIGADLLDQDTLWARLVSSATAAIVTNESVAPLYARRVEGALERLGKRTVTIVLPDGEAHKEWRTLERIFDGLLQARCDRGTTVVALGGGVVGDMAGFAAATYQRGVPFVQVPTTLLAQVDASVGGKTAINHALGKNMIGAFHQPVGVLIDVTTLDTLPARELRAGLAEVIKHGAACDAGYFAALESDMGRLLERDRASLVRAIEGSCRIKAAVVRADEREAGMRAVLNFGHTFGHAIEAGVGYGTWLHGEAVAAGMVLAATLSCRLGSLLPEARERIVALIERADLPTAPPRLARSVWLELMAIDKKALDGRTRFVVLTGLGSAEVRAVPESDVTAALAQCNALQAEPGSVA